MVADGRTSAPVRASRLAHHGLATGQALARFCRVGAMFLFGSFPRPARHGC